MQLLFTKNRAGYIQTKPLHHSQKTYEQEKGKLLVKLQLIVNRELIQQILQFGADVQVLAPENLVETQVTQN